MSMSPVGSIIPIVPVAVVFVEQEKTFCYVVSGGRVRRAPVKVGRMNDQDLEIASGLNEGDEVLLVPPSSEALSGAPVMPEQDAEGGRS